VCGSYRRCKESSGDVDILLAPPDGKEDVDILPALIDRLVQVGLLAKEKNFISNIVLKFFTRYDY